MGVNEQREQLDLKSLLLTKGLIQHPLISVGKFPLTWMCFGSGPNCLPLVSKTRQKYDGLRLISHPYKLGDSLGRNPSLPKTVIFISLLNTSRSVRVLCGQHTPARHEQSGQMFVSGSRTQTLNWDHFFATKGSSKHLFCTALQLITPLAFSLYYTSFLILLPLTLNFSRKQEHWTKDNSPRSLHGDESEGSSVLFLDVWERLRNAWDKVCPSVHLYSQPFPSLMLIGLDYCHDS